MGNSNCCFMIIAGFFSTANHRTHTALFSSNLFHWRIAQIAIHQLSDPGNTKCSPWKVFETNHPQSLQLLSRIGPGSPEARLSQHYIGLAKITSKVAGGLFQNFFKDYTFLFSGSLSWWIAIWVICPWNKFEEKAQCEYTCPTYAQSTHASILGDLGANVHAQTINFWHMPYVWCYFWPTKEHLKMDTLAWRKPFLG